jgi:hypothetical protein
MGAMNAEHDRQSDALQRIIEDLVYEHVRVSGDTFQIDTHTWVIHGFIAVDGDVIMAKFDSQDDADAAIQRLWQAEDETGPT